MADDYDRSAGPAEPFDDVDPRYSGVDGPVGGPRLPRGLVASRGPGLSPDNPKVTLLRVIITGVFVAGVVVTIALFAAGLRGESASSVVRAGEEGAVRAAVADRPRRICVGQGPPCAWLTVLDGDLLALSTSGPTRAEFGRQGVGWCASAGRFASEATGSRYDQRGRVVDGPAPRGLDRYGIDIEDGEVWVDFLRVTTNLQSHRNYERTPPSGPDCVEVPFDRDADLDLD